MGRSAEPDIGQVLLIVAIGYLAITGNLGPTIDGVATWLHSWTVTTTTPPTPPVTPPPTEYPQVVDQQILLYESFDGGGKTYTHGLLLGDYPLFRLMGDGITLKNVVIDDGGNFLALSHTYAAIVISGSGNRVEGITLNNCVRYGIATLDATNFYIGHNTVTAAQYCISGSGGTSSGGVIEYNNLSGMTNCGFKAKNWVNVNVRNNFVDLTPWYIGRAPDGVNFSDDTPNLNMNVVFQGNEFRRVQEGVGGYTKGLTTDAGCTLSGNKFIDNTVTNLPNSDKMYSAILNGDNFVVTGNTFTGCEPIQVNSGATGNTVSPNNGLTPPSSSTVVSTELINFSGATAANIDTFLNLCDQQGLTELTLRFNSMNTFQTEQPSSAEVSAAKSIITKAKTRGIAINIDLHTWYTTWDNYFRDTASNAAANRLHYKNYVKNAIAAMSGYDIKAWMVLNEPQARTASASENQFLLDVLAVANTATTAPISIRFMAGYSPTTGHYSSTINQQTDFLCVNTYYDPRTGAEKWGTTSTTLPQAVQTATSLGKELWITEFGSSSAIDSTQADYIRAFVAYSKTIGADRIYGWVCQLYSGEAYNLLNNVAPRPAFLELK